MVALTQQTEFVVPYHVLLGLAFVVLMLSPPTLRTLGNIDPAFLGKDGGLTGAGASVFVLIILGLASAYVFTWLQADWIA